MLHFQRRGSQLLDSSTKTCERKERKKKQLTSTKNRTKTASKEKTEKTLGNYSLYRDLKQNAFFLFAFYEFFLLWFLSIIDTLLPRTRSLSFLNYWTDINYVTTRGSSAKFFQNGMIAFSVLDKAGMGFYQT